MMIQDAGNELRSLSERVDAADRASCCNACVCCIGYPLIWMGRVVSKHVTYDGVNFAYHVCEISGSRWGVYE